MDKLGDIKHIFAKEIINVTTNRTITVKNKYVVKNRKEKKKCFALRQLAQNQFQTDGIRDEILSSYTLSCMSYHTMYPILVHKNLSVMAGFEPASDTSKPKEGSRSRRSTTREGRETTPISLPLFQKPTKPFNQNGWSVT